LGPWYANAVVHLDVDHLKSPTSAIIGLTTLDPS
jgi:hypothetical protein